MTDISLQKERRKGNNLAMSNLCCFFEKLTKILSIGFGLFEYVKIHLQSNPLHFND